MLTDKFKGAFSSPKQRPNSEKGNLSFDASSLKTRAERGGDGSHDKLGADHRLIPEEQEEGSHSEEDV